MNHSLITNFVEYKCLVNKEALIISLGFTIFGICGAALLGYFGLMGAVEKSKNSLMEGSTAKAEEGDRGSDGRALCIKTLIHARSSKCLV